MPAAADPVTPLPADDQELFGLDLRGLRRRWAATAALPPIGAERMTGADKLAQALGVPGQRLMEHAGVAGAAAGQGTPRGGGGGGEGPVPDPGGPGHKGAG